jgi:hypothetical protein
MIDDDDGDDDDDDDDDGDDDDGVMVRPSGRPSISGWACESERGR